jgi:hypothetical protein
MVYKLAVNRMFNNWVMHPVACITNTLIKTTVRNKYLFVLDFIVHYYTLLHNKIEHE